MKKPTLIFLFALTILVQLFFPLKIIHDQYMARTYGEESFEKIELRYCKDNALFYQLDNSNKREEIFLKKEVINALDPFYAIKNLDAKLKVKTLGNKRAIIDIVLENYALKNISDNDLILFKAHLQNLKEKRDAKK